MLQSVVKHDIYRHYKNKLYNIITLAIDHRTNIKYVVYNSMYGNNESWIRPHNMFFERVNHNDVEMDRFTYLSKNIDDYENVKKDLNTSKYSFEPNIYSIMGIATHTENLQDYVIYEDTTINKVFAITLDDAVKFKICKSFKVLNKK